MARGSFLAGMIKSGILSAALVAGLALPAYADDAKLTLSGSATITSDYMFRSVSNTSQNPAVQPEFDLTYGMFYAYIWGSNTAAPVYGEGIEIDYGGGITPKWAGIDFNIAGLYYTYPGASDIDYFELRTSAAHTFDKLTLSLGNWWSPDNFGAGTQSDAIEFGASYAFSGKLWNFFTPSISGAVGRQMYENQNIYPDYTYWNAGLTLGFLEHWSADIRYYDTDYSKTDCAINSGSRDSCDARAVGTIKATF
jgi:uncharacterized protein (TIGR02001 family)